MTALDDIQSLLNAMRDRGAEMSAFKACLAEIAQNMTDIVMLLEKPEAPEQENPAMMVLLERLQIPPATVNVSAVPSINVMPAPIQFMPAPAAAPVAWKLSITRRDDMGNIRDISITQE